MILADCYYASQIFAKGICFGHQAVARAFGGACVQNNGRWEVGTTAIELTNTGKEIFGVPSIVSRIPSLLILVSVLTIWVCRHSAYIKCTVTMFPHSRLDSYFSEVPPSPKFRE